jgi:acetyl-CoA carboxylase beta subunit
LENLKVKVICCMDFAFIGGSMGSCGWEDFKRNKSLNQNNIPL